MACPNNVGPFAVSQNLNLPDGAKFKLQAWISNFGSTNVHIFAGALSLGDCQQRIEQGFIDMLMTLPSAGPGEIWLPDVSGGNVTIMFEALNNSGQAQVVTMRVLTRV